MKFRENNITGKNYLIFKKWGRKSYSLFSILHKLVKISVLSVSYFLVVPVLSFAMERDTTDIKMEFDLDEIEVSASRVPMLYSQIARVLTVIENREIERAPVQSVQDLLEYVAGVDIRQRGAEGVQADISIRGGSFDQTLILLNGINITDPQTGHHNLNLPVSLSQIERIEILEGPAARVYGPNAFSGAINIVTRQPDFNSIAAHFSAGSFGYLNSDVSGSVKTGQFVHLLAGNLKNSDGYIENTDFLDLNFFYSGKFKAQNGKLTLQAGISDKEFGANSFYTPVYPNQFEQIQTLFTSVKWDSQNAMHLTPAVYWRRLSDKFMLFREDAPEWYQNHNYHRTDVYGATINSWFLWAGGKTSVGAEIRSENILSNLLGEEIETPEQVPGKDAFYTKSKSRSTSSVFLEHIFHHAKWNISGGIMGNYITGSGSGVNFFPGADISYFIRPSLKLVASWNTSLRMPTFTDLYYSGPTNEGNAELKPEKTMTFEGGVKFNSKYVNSHAVIYLRQGTNLIDWVKTENETVWRSMNHTQINSKGIEFNLKYLPAEHLGEKWPQVVNIGYFFNNQSKEEGALISYYILDNLRHKFVASVNQQVTRKISVDFKFRFQDREGTFSLFRAGESAVETPYNPFWLIDAKILYQKNNFSLYISSSNLLNKSYFDLGNIIQPGRWIKTGISYKIDFDN